MMAADSMYRCCTDVGRKMRGDVELRRACAVLEEARYQGVNPQQCYQPVSFQSDK